LRIDLNADRRLLLAADADQAHSSNLYARWKAPLSSGHAVDLFQLAGHESGASSDSTAGVPAKLGK
jgi:hypothetical protein